MSVIDFHTHAFPDGLADRAIASLTAQAGGHATASLDGRVGSLIGSMDAAGIDRSVICPIATRPEQFDGIVDWGLSIRSDRIIPLGSIHPDADVADHARRLAESGLVGLKLHPFYQGFVADDPRVDDLYDAIAAESLLVVMHCGQDFSFPDQDDAMPSRIAAVLDRHPDLRMVAAHLGGWKAWDEVRKHLLGRDLWMEMSFSLTWMPDEEVVELITAHGCEKVLFGTDSPWADQSRDIQHFGRLALTDAQKRAVLGGNARRLLGETV